MSNTLINTIKLLKLEEKIIIVTKRIDRITRNTDDISFILKNVEYIYTYNRIYNPKNDYDFSIISMKIKKAQEENEFKSNEYKERRKYDLILEF